MATHVCNKCGKKFDKYDIYGGLSINAFLGYGTKFDSETLSLDLCCDCTEQQIEVWLETFKYTPLMGDECIGD